MLAVDHCNEHDVPPRMAGWLVRPPSTSRKPDIEAAGERFAATGSAETPASEERLIRTSSRAECASGAADLVWEYAEANAAPGCDPGT